MSELRQLNLKGLIISYGKADMSPFFTDMALTLKSLELGVEIKYSRDSRICKFYLLFAVFDKPARASSLNLVNSTGFFSCLQCLQRGKSIKTSCMF